MKITGTFIDEISHDIPHQNWGYKEWEMDFQHMKSVGIDTVILIRCGYRKFLTYPSEYLMTENHCYNPGKDLLQMFLNLSDKYDMSFYLGLYDSGVYWDTGNLDLEISHNQFVIDEVWQKYGHHNSFKGWYLSLEISRKTKGAIDAFRNLGLHCKAVSGGLPTFISPWVDGKKAILAAQTQLMKKDAVTLKEHEKEWSEIMDGIKGAVDAVAFQDGHLDYDELYDFLVLNKQMADRYGLESWTNIESFDRDMPIKFLPIKFEKLRMKIEAAKKANYEKAITFEFSHFMSPQSSYKSANNLFNRYREYLKGDHKL